MFSYSLNQAIPINLPKGISLVIKREDLIHPFVSGNKFRKLKYNLLQAKAENQSTLLTFGGAYSNHIAAVAYAGKENGFQTIGIIRGDELGDKIESNPTLKFAQECGMQFEFVSRETYRLKTEATFLEQLQQHLEQVILRHIIPYNLVVVHTIHGQRLNGIQVVLHGVIQHQTKKYFNEKSISNWWMWVYWF